MNIGIENTRRRSGSEVEQDSANKQRDTCERNLSSFDRMERAYETLLRDHTHLAKTSHVIAPMTVEARSAAPFGRNAIVTAEKGANGNPEGTAEAYAKQRPGRSVTVGTSQRGYGITEQLRNRVTSTGEKVDRVDAFGHTAAGLGETPGSYNLSESTAKALAPYLAQGATIVTHGCGGQTGVYGFTKEFLSALPSGTVLYNHRNKASPGQPFNWVRNELVENNGKATLRTTRLRGDDQVVGKLVSREFVQWWCHEVKTDELRASYHDPRNDVTNDVKAIMAQEYKARTGLDINKPLGGPAKKP